MSDREQSRVSKGLLWACAVLTIPLHGWVFTVLWGWFVMPVFHLPPLKIAQACGLILLARMVPMIKTSATPEPLVTDYGRRVLTLVLWPGITLGLGAIIRMFL